MRASSSSTATPRPPRKVFDTISDNAANAGIVPGGRPVKPDAVDLRWVGALLYKNGVIEEIGRRRGRAQPSRRPASPGWPTSSRLTTSASRPAKSCWAARSRARPPRGRGDTFHVDYGPLGSIAFRFA